MRRNAEAHRERKKATLAQIGAAAQTNHTTRITEGDTPMTAWASDELSKIGVAEELQIASVRRDSTLRNPVTI